MTVRLALPLVLAVSNSWIWWYMRIGRLTQGPYKEFISAKVRGLGVGVALSEAVGVIGGVVIVGTDGSGIFW